MQIAVPEGKKKKQLLFYHHLNLRTKQGQDGRRILTRKIRR